jgi:hypothetical protein
MRQTKFGMRNAECGIIGRGVLPRSRGGAPARAVCRNNNYNFGITPTGVDLDFNGVSFNAVHGGIIELRRHQSVEGVAAARGDLKLIGDGGDREPRAAKC